jgi:hypothetical protein
LGGKELNGTGLTVVGQSEIFLAKAADGLARLIFDHGVDFDRARLGAQNDR